MQPFPTLGPSRRAPGSIAVAIALLAVGGCDTTEPSAPPEPEPFVVHLSPTGDDGADGASPATALLTLQAAHDLLEAVDPPAPVHVEIAPGRYHLQQTAWTWLPDGPLRLRWAVPGERPIFDGCGPGDTPCPGGAFLTFELADGALSRVDVEGLYIERYQRGIYFRGDREDPGAYNGGNRVAECVFAEIGNAYNLDLGDAFGAVTLVNSRENVIEDNRFDRLLNFYNFNLLHAVYLAHHSDDNIVRGNHFDIVSGDAVRVRDSSDRNLIEGNRFVKSGFFALGDWYCERDSGAECTKMAPECPSFGNIVAGNVFDGGWPMCDAIDTAEIWQDDVETGCEPAAAGAVRFEAYDNTVAEVSACTPGVDEMQRP